MKIVRTVIITLLTLYWLAFWNNAYGIDIPKPFHIIALEHYLESVQAESEIYEHTYYDIPLSNELQDFTKNQAEYEKIPYELVLAVMEIESSFNSDIISITNDYGLTQINIINHAYLTEIFGITDFLDAKNNIICGVYLLSELYHSYDGDLYKTLMAYNMGRNGAKKYWDNGIYTSTYSEKVVQAYEKYKEVKQ